MMMFITMMMDLLNGTMVIKNERQKKHKSKKS